MIQKQFDKIEKADLDSLVANEAREGRNLDYKQQLPSNANKDKKELLADVSSFANATGGDLLIGVVEKRDGEGKTTGVPENVPGLAGINADAEVRRLENMIRDGIKPRIAGIQVRTIEGFSDGPALLLRIPRSFAAPHMVTFQDHSRFYSRNSGGKYPLDVTEIRSAFALSESLPERIRRFREERLARIVAADTPLVLGDGPKLVLHIMPLSALVAGTAIDIDLLRDQYGGLPLPCFDMAGHHCRFNFDGLLSFDTRAEGGEGVAYAQAFRNGAAEFVDTWTLSGAVQAQRLPVTKVEKSLIRGLREYVRIVKNLGVTPPLVAMPTLLGVRGCHIVRGDFHDTYPPIDRDDLLLPDVTVEEFGQQPATVLRPALDAIWQAAGWRRSFNYNKEGEWVEQY
jgi:hypothetical protein